MVDSKLPVELARAKGNGARCRTATSSEDGGWSKTSGTDINNCGWSLSDTSEPSEKLVSSGVSCLSTAFSTKSLSRLETGERGTVPKIDEPVATLLNAESALFLDAVSVEVVLVALGSKDIPAVINLDEPRTFAEPRRDGDKNDGDREFIVEWDSDCRTAESSEIVRVRSRRLCA